MFSSYAEHLTPLQSKILPLFCTLHRILLESSAFPQFYRCHQEVVQCALTLLLREDLRPGESLPERSSVVETSTGAILAGVPVKVDVR